MTARWPDRLAGFFVSYAIIMLALDDSFANTVAVALAGTAAALFMLGGDR